MKKKYQKAYSVILVLIIGSSVIGLIFGNFIHNPGTTLGSGSAGQNTFEFNEFEFAQRGAVWSTYVGNREAIFSFTPQDVSFLQLDTSIANRIRNTAQIDTTSNVLDNNSESIALSVFQLSEMVRFHSSTFVRQGFDTVNEFGFPIITCDDATEVVPVLYFQTGLSTNIYSVGNCIVVEAPSQAGFLMAKDRLLYAYFGIMN